jgi:pimeloyl-ACP methyl ester carboxylesterase
MDLSHVTAPTEFQEMQGDLIAFRRFGANDATPILLLNHYRAGMDHWDSFVTDGLAQTRTVILYDYRGVASSSGVPRESPGWFYGNRWVARRELRMSVASRPRSRFRNSEPCDPYLIGTNDQSGGMSRAG